jgi:hypothetical protein
MAFCVTAERPSIPPCPQSLTLWTHDTSASALTAACSPASEPLTRNMTSLATAPSNPDASDAAAAANAARAAMRSLLDEHTLLGTGREPPLPRSPPSPIAPTPTPLLPAAPAAVLSPATASRALHRFQALRSSLQACTPSRPQAEGGSGGSLSLGLPPVRMGLAGGLSGAWQLDGVWSLLPGTVFSATVQLLDLFGQPVTVGACGQGHRPTAACTRCMHWHRVLLSWPACDPTGCHSLVLLPQTWRTSRSPYSSYPRTPWDSPLTSALRGRMRRGATPASPPCRSEDGAVSSAP